MDAPVRGAQDPAALPVAALEGSCTFRSLLAPIPDPLERSRPLRPLPRYTRQSRSRFRRVQGRHSKHSTPAGWTAPSSRPRPFRFPRAMILDAGLGPGLLAFGAV